jgi:hypothetical protein
VVFTAMLWLLASGLSLGFGSLLGVAATRAERGEPVVPPSTPKADAGTTTPAPGDQLDRWQEWTTTPRTPAAWWSLLGTVLSMIASVAGAVMGAGRTMVLRRFIVTDGFRRTNAPGRVLVQ